MSAFSGIDFLYYPWALGIDFNDSIFLDFGLKLHGILAGKEVLSEKLVPQFSLTVTDLFAV